MERRPVRIANCSGFFGDRHAAAAEMVGGGPIDVLTGDWLAELTMLILAKQRMKHGSGYARTFLTQMADVLGTCLDRGIKVVTNAGGLDPAGLARALGDQCAAAGLAPRIAHVTGDDLSGRMDQLQQAGETFTNIDTGQTLTDAGVAPLTANAYIGGRGITSALDAGADVVITGRATDAAVVIGPTAWWHGWAYDDPDHLDRMAGALVAGHVIECGAQATGGNYAFFADVPGIEHIGFPIAEIAADGDSVITKHDDTGGLVSVGTVTAQLLYEIGGPAYLNPDVSADFRSIRVAQQGPNRVGLSGIRGIAPPDRLKVSMNYLGGVRNTLTLVLTGLDIEAKADVALRSTVGVDLADIGLGAKELAARSRLSIDELVVDLLRCDQSDPTGYATAQAHLRLTAKGADPKALSRGFTAPVVEAALASYPGFFPTAAPGPAVPFAVFWPTTVAGEQVGLTVHLDDEPLTSLPAQSPLAVSQNGAQVSAPFDPTPADLGSGAAVRRPLGTFIGARSGDKGGNANLGLWVRDPAEDVAAAMASEPATAAEPPQPSPSAHDLADARYNWLRALLPDADAVRRLLPQVGDLSIDVHPLPNLRAINIVVTGLLGRGVSDSTSLDPQAKGLGELIRAAVVDVPEGLLDVPAPSTVSRAAP